MTRRNIEHRLNSLENDTHGSIREWIEDCMNEGFNYRIAWGKEPDHTGQVCVLEDGKVSYYVDRSDIPAWIDENELPVR